MRLPWRREPRYTRQQIEDHLADHMVHWLPISWEGTVTPEKRTSDARAAAVIIADELPPAVRTSTRMIREGELAKAIARDSQGSETR